MKNKIKCTLLIALVIVILICVRYYIVNKTYTQLYLDTKNNLVIKNIDTKINDVTIYYYKYYLSDDNKIDDIELVKKKTINSTTGEIIINK